MKHSHRTAARSNHIAVCKTYPLAPVRFEKLVADSPVSRLVLAPVRVDLLAISSGNWSAMFCMAHLERIVGAVNILRAFGRSVERRLLPGIPSRRSRMFRTTPMPRPDAVDIGTDSHLMSEQKRFQEDNLHLHHIRCVLASFDAVAFAVQLDVPGQRAGGARRRDDLIGFADLHTLVVPAMDDQERFLDPLGGASGEIDCKKRRVSGSRSSPYSTRQ